jgi:hypothetical protein
MHKGALHQWPRSGDEFHSVHQLTPNALDHRKRRLLFAAINDLAGATRRGSIHAAA